uniref:GxxExxY protein n=1 Tax=Ignavibacterium album TaxID=591197 RepID=A0A7V2ZHV7_9BACT
MDREQLNKLGSIILDASIEVHKQLGPGLLETVYELSLFKELTLRNLNVRRQVPVPVMYKGEDLNAEFKIDILVENEIIIELKAVETLLPVHSAQLLTYLRLTEKKLGYLINFNVPKLIEGFNRIVNNF